MDPSDMIFSHVGFASAGNRKDSTVDYSKTTTKVFENSAKYIAMVYGLPTLVSCNSAGDFSECLMGLPSWVLDWTRILRKREVWHRSK